ncbi:MAG: LPXTG cell wall anchor domain-containing protein [Tenuifilaceae bacterium]
MKFFKLLITIVLTIHSLSIQSQTKREIDELYKDANSYFYFEDYEEAVALYLQVYNHHPENYNLCYKIGLCYLNIPGYKQQSIPFLEKAAANTKKNYSEQSITETKAPYDAIFYLGNAYFITNQLEKAQKEYSRFKELIKNERSWNLSYYEHQVSTIKSSQTIQSLPVNFIRNNFGEPLNDRFANYNPVISGDEKTIAYTTKQKFYQAIYVTRKVNDSWSKPVNITLDLEVDGNCSTLSISNDGNELYLYKDDLHDGNIYVTRYFNGRWNPMQKLSENVNSKYYETHASISANGKQLYFTSNRKGGFGDHDIYVSERDSTDNWGPAKNLGSTINSSLNENTPFITIDGSTLFFSSEGHNNMGGYDIFFSQKMPDGSWSKPINLGYPINTTDDDLFYTPIGDGSYGLMALFDSDGFGEQDIYKVEMFAPRYLKAIMTTTELSERQLDKRFKTLIIDTLNKSGIALLDPSKSEIVTYLDQNKNFKLFYHGKGYDLRDQANEAKTIVSKLNTSIKNEKIPTFSMLNPSNDQINKEGIEQYTTVQQRIDQLRTTTDTSHTIRSTTKDEAKKEDQNLLTSSTEKATLAETSYLPEILVLLSSGKSQDKMSGVLKGNWHFPSTLLKLRINQLTQAVDSSGNPEELLITFTKLLDLLCSSEFVKLKNQSRTISGETNNNAFTYLFNQIKDKASPELTDFLDKVYQKYPTVNSFAKLWKLMQNEDAEGFQKLLPELIKLIAEIGVETYISLPEDQKFKLYQDLTIKAEPKSLSWVIYVLVGFALIGIAGFIYFRRRKN